MGYGIFDFNNTILKRKKEVGLIAAGTGITPLFSIAQASVLSNDGIKMTMLTTNKTKNDILCK